jgi:hypothetical protein
MEYTKHFVCFLDILGFKNSILNSKSPIDIEKTAKLLGYFKYFREKFREMDSNEVIRFATNEEKTKIELNLKFKASFFSDSLIISYEVAEFRQDLMQLYYIIYNLAELIFEITLYCKVFIRGGLTFGDLYHEDDVCFGPALIEAVQLENEAVFPRVSVSPKIVDYTGQDFPFKYLDINKDFTLERALAYIQREMLSTDLTGNKPVHYIDFLWRFLPESEKIASRLKDIITTQLNTDYDDHIMKKYIWFAKCFNFILGSYTQHKIEPISISNSLLDSFNKQICEPPSYLLHF